MNTVPNERSEQDPRTSMSHPMPVDESFGCLSLTARAVNVARLATTRGVPWSSLKVALVVGTALNALNQGDQLLGSGAGSLDWGKTLLNYVVPYLVSTCGAVSSKLRDGK